MRCLLPMFLLCLAIAGCGGGMTYDIAPLPGSTVNPGGDEPYCPSGQQPPCN